MDLKVLEFTFDKGKAIAAILYVAPRIDDPTFLRICKLLYFADKTSLEKYGRFIAGDTYFAMEHGPVPAHTYNLMREAAHSEGLGFTTDGGHQVVPLADPDLGELSESDIECLDTIIDLYGRAPVWKLRQDSHDFAYDDAWENRGGKNSARMSIENIVSLLESADELLDFLITQHDD
jgi:uncharacterized phage-associated protein